MNMLFVFFLCIVVTFAQYPIGTPRLTPEIPAHCEPGPKGRIPWILSKRQPDFGWKEHTHRANIALAVNKYKGETHEMEQMRQQLEVEVTKALMWNSESPIHDNDLALLIHALIALAINPRDFHGIDLVADLRQRVDNQSIPHPFLVLALCNSHAVDYDDLVKLRGMATFHGDTETVREIEMKALALKAFACAASLPAGTLSKFRDYMKQAAEGLAAKQSREDGSFGNAYTTSLVIQALVAYNNRRPAWNESAATNFLLKESVIAVNMIKAYYIEMALNSRSVPFIKKLYPGIIRPPESPELDIGYFVQYTIKGAPFPDTYFTVTTKVRPNTDFFSIMSYAQLQSNKFQFSHYINENGDPMVYKMINIPNDAEENMFWRICVQRNYTDVRYSESVNTSPANFIPSVGNHIIMWYRDSECPIPIDS